MTFARGLRAILRQDPDVVHDRRDPRPRDGADRRAGEPHRPPGALDAAHQHRRRRRHAPARHGHRAVPAVLEPDRRAGAAPGARADPGQQAALHRRRVRAAPAEPRAQTIPRRPCTARPRRRRRLPRPHRHLRAHHRRRHHAHHDPRRRLRAGTRAPRAHSAPLPSATTAAPGCCAARRPSRKCCASRARTDPWAPSNTPPSTRAARSARASSRATPRVRSASCCASSSCCRSRSAEVAQKRPGASAPSACCGGVSPSDLALFTRQLATLVRAGLPLEESLLAVSQQTEKPRVQSIVLGVRARVMEGHTLADGFAEFPRVFPEIYRATVAAGEQAGHLDNVLERLADYTESREQIRQKVLAAMLYPIVLTVMCFAIVSGLLVFVVPKVVGRLRDQQGQAAADHPRADRHQRLPARLRHLPADCRDPGVDPGGALAARPRSAAPLPPAAAAYADARQAVARLQHGALHPHLQHPQRQLGAGAGGDAHRRRGGHQPADAGCGRRMPRRACARAPPSAAPWPRAACFRR